MQERKVSNDLAGDKNAWKSFIGNCPSHARMANKYGNDEVNANLSFFIVFRKAFDYLQKRKEKKKLHIRSICQQKSIFDIFNFFYLRESSLTYLYQNC